MRWIMDRVLTPMSLLPRYVYMTYLYDTCYICLYTVYIYTHFMVVNIGPGSPA